MSDTGKKETLSLSGEARRASVRGGDSAPPRSGIGGGRKTVKVEVRRKRPAVTRARSGAPESAPKAEESKAQAPAAAPQPSAPAAAAPTPAPAPAKKEVKPRHVIRALSDEEKAARARALGNALAADEAARARADENARRRLEEERRLNEERELAERRRLEEEERKRKEDDARRKAEEEASRKLSSQEVRRPAEEAAAAPRSAEDTERKVTRPPRQGEETPAERERLRRVAEKARQQPRSRGEPRRRSGRLTVSKVLSGDEERTRSLASMRRERERRKQEMRGEMGAEAGKVVRDVVVPETITVQELANRMAERAVDVIKSLMGMGVMATVNQTLDADTAELIVNEFGHKLRRVSEADVEIGMEGEADEEGDLQPRAPVITVMGHVDHGKTSLLDAIRQTDVVSGEAGGITQHIGAYQVTSPSGGRLTFIDTPGHAAFTAMRARGAQVTDIVVLVVAANDSVMPQTVEAINHAKAAKVPMIVAVNKIDLPDANPQKVKQDLLQYEVISEEFGGDVQMIEVSAVTRDGLDDLLEAINLQSEVLELKANPDRAAGGVIVEAQLDRGRGPVATVLVQRGTLKIGDVFVAGSEWGRVRALQDSRGERLELAGPSTPVEILGLQGTPSAGDEFHVLENEGRAREIAEYRQRQEREKRAVTGARASLEQMLSQIQAGEIQELPVIVKADVQGSLEAIVNAIESLGNDEVRARILHAGVGGITESDVELARASNTFVIGFNVRANAQARDTARQEGVEFRYYSIIYELVDELKQLLSGMLAPEVRETAIGTANVLEVFSVSKIGRVAGCRVSSGMVRRTARARLLRDDVVIHDGVLKSLKRFKDDANEVREGNECGIALENYQDIRQGDQLEFYEVEEVQRAL